MKKIFTTYGKLCKLPLGWSLWGLLFFLIFATACTNDVAEVNTSQQQEQYVTVRMNVPGMQTTVSRTAEDGLIETVHALAFNSEGTHLGTSEATNLNNVNANDGYNGTFSLKVPNGTTTIHFLANLPDDYDLLGVNKESDLCNLSIGDWQNLCYWGMATTFDGNTNPLSVTLYRNLARISIKPSVTAPELNQFTQEQLKMTGFYMPNERGALIPNNNGTFDFDMNSNYCTIPQDVTSANYQLWEFTSMYAFEHENTDSNPTYIICKIGDYHYKVALVDDEGNRYPIIRNHEYIIYVSDVDDYAYDSDYRAEIYSDAFDKKPINLEVEEVEYETVEVSMAASTNTLDYNTTSISNLVLSVTVPPEVNTLTLNTPGFTVATFSDTSYKIDENANQYYLVKNDDGSFTVNHPENDEEHTFSFRLKLDDNPQQSSYNLSCTAASNDANVQITQPMDVAVSLNKVDEDTNVYWMGASPLDYYNSPSKIPISAAKLTKGATVTLEYVKGEGNAEIGLQHAGWEDFENGPTLDLSQNTTSFKITQELYNEIQSNKGWIYEVENAGMVIQGQNITLTKITIDPTEDVALTVNHTTASLYYDSDNTQEITVTVPVGKTLAELTITPSVDCFTITPATGELAGPTNGVYTYAPDGGVTGTVTFTIAPSDSYNFTSNLTSDVVFDGTGVDMNVSTVQTTVTLTAKPAITADADKATLYYDTDNQTTTVTVNIPKGVSALSITATDFTVALQSGNGNLNGNTYTLNDTNGQTAVFVFTMNNISSSSGKTFTTIAFSDPNNIATYPAPITISLAEKPEDVTSLVVTPVGSTTIDLSENGNKTVKLTLSIPSNAPTSMTIATNFAFDVVETNLDGRDGGNAYYYDYINTANKVTNINLTLGLSDDIFGIVGDYTITFSNSSESIPITIKIVNNNLEEGVLWEGEKTVSYGNLCLNKEQLTNYKGETIKMDIITSGTDWAINIGNSNYQYNSNLPQSNNMTLDVDIPENLDSNISITGKDVTITRIYTVSTDL